MSKILQRASAGTLESSDAFVTLEPLDSGVEIAIESVVMNQFGQAIRRAVEEVLAQQDVQGARISVIDRGALDCVIRARVETAVLRGKGEC